MILGMDWRPLVGLRPEDAGTPVERALARAVLARVYEARTEAANAQRG